MRFQNKAEYVLLLVLRWIIQKTPLKLLHICGNLLGVFIFYVVPIRRKVTLENLSHAFPEKSSKERWEIAKKCYCHFSKMILEIFKFSSFDEKKLERYFNFTNKHLLNEVYKKGQGGILILGHFGSWEIVGQFLSKTGHKISVIYKSQRNPFVTKMINEHRTQSGIGTIHRSKGKWNIRRTLKQNHFIVILVDQDANKNGEFVDFFGRKASTPKGPATLARKLQIPLIMAYPLRSSTGTFNTLFEKLDIDGLDENEIIQAYTTALEKAIRKCPEQWFWMHRRWKTAEKLGLA